MTEKRHFRGDGDTLMRLAFDLETDGLLNELTKTYILLQSEMLTPTKHTPTALMN